MPYCSHCGEKASSEKRFCANCGHRIEAQTRDEENGSMGKTCPYCQAPIKRVDNVVVCPKCETPHHQECWQENNGCTIFGCSSAEKISPQIDLSQQESSATSSTLPPGPIPNYLTQAILVTLFCFMPFGIPAIVYASQVNNKIAYGDYRGALESSQKAKSWYVAAMWTGIIIGILFILGGGC